MHPILEKHGIENAHQLIGFTIRKLGYDNRITNHSAYAIFAGELPSIVQACKLMNAFDIGLNAIYEVMEDG